ncbi:MAG: T9SS type A sorting domain-containing protein, partial [Paludibacter sp.]|nr:T9SS type A sorting domain-containing protein [Paludibacter sp.]
ILKIQTYSPYTDQYCTDAGQHFYYNNVQYMKSNGQYVKNQPTGTENPEYSHLTVLPGSQQVRIINEGSNNLNVIVYNLQGIRIAERTGSSNFDIPVPVSGCYIITVNDNTQSYTMRKKIVVK